MRQLTQLFLAFAISLYSINALANNFNYSYTDIGLSIIDNDGADAAGIGGQFSHAIDDQFRLKLGAAYSEGLDVDVWIEDLVVTAGYVSELQSSTDLVIDVGFLVEWFENNFFDDSDTGLYLSGMLRHKVDNGMEIFGGLAYHSLFDDSDVAFNAGLIFSPSSRTSLGINAVSADVSSITVFLRLYSN